MFEDERLNALLRVLVGHSQRALRYGDGGARPVESGAGCLEGMALSGRHEVILVDNRPWDKPFQV
ncbi:hypothetical protein ACRJ4B_15045 [Streptomyces sp. GTA36]|uniref:hypothetical protein n=1 Tax=Streptomyces sp. 2-1 TaxID=412710 RepID=UPI003AFA2872